MQFLKHLLNSFDLVIYELKNKRTKTNIKRRKYNINAGEIIICKYNNYKCMVVDNNNSIKIKSIDERLNDDNIYSLSGFCAKYIKTNRERANFHGHNWFTYNKLPLKNFITNWIFEVMFIFCFYKNKLIKIILVIIKKSHDNEQE